MFCANLTRTMNKRGILGNVKLKKKKHNGRERETMQAVEKNLG